MGVIENYQPVHHLGISLSETPSHDGTPVMANNNGMLAIEVMQNCRNIARQELDVVALNVLWLVALVVTALRHRDDFIRARERYHLIPPFKPLVGVTVDEEH